MRTIGPPPDRTVPRPAGSGPLGAALGILARSGRWWLLPLGALVLVLAVVWVALRSMPTVAPFVYVVF